MAREQHSREDVCRKEDTIVSKTKHYTANDIRSMVKNSNHSTYAADRANRIALGHANVPPPPAPAPAADGSGKK